MNEKPERPHPAIGESKNSASFAEAIRKWRVEVKAWEAGHLNVPIDPEDCEGFFITTPFIDAYSHGDGERMKTSWHTFEPAMREQADEWGDQGIGLQVRRGNTIAAVTNERTDTNHVVLAIGRFGSRKFAVISKNEHEVEFIEHDWNDEWNVTGYG